jgi:transposase
MRTITIKEEQAYRLCHPDFDGKSQAEASKIMGISQQAISKLVQRAIRKGNLPPLPKKPETIRYERHMDKDVVERF